MNFRILLFLLVATSLCLAKAIQNQDDEKGTAGDYLSHCTRDVIKNAKSMIKISVIIMENM